MTSHTLPVTPEELLGHRAWVRSLVRRLVRDENVADDLEQDTWATALARPPAHREGLRGWLGTVLRSRLKDRHRSETRRARREELAPRSEQPLSPAEIAARADAHRKVMNAVMTLDEPHRDVVLLRHFEGLAPAEIASRLDIPASTVRTRLHRAHAKLREQLDATHDGDRGRWRAALAPLLFTPAPRWGLGVRIAALALMAAGLGAIGVAFVIEAMAPSTNAVPAAPHEPAAARGDAPQPGRTTRERVTPPSAAVAVGNESEDVAAAEPAAPAAPEDEAAEVVTHPVRVEVVDADDLRRGGVDVRVEVFDSDGPKHSPPRWREIGRVATDSHGVAVVEAPADEWVRARALDGESGAASAMVKVTADSPVVILELEETISLSGRALDDADRPVPDAAVMLALRMPDHGLEMFGSLRSGTDGRFVFKGVPVSLLDEPGTLRAAKVGLVDGVTSVPAGGAPESGLTIVLRTSITVTGRIVDEAGEPVSDVLVQPRRHPGGVWTARDGTFRVGGVPRAGVEFHVQPDAHVHRVVTVPETTDDTTNVGDVAVATGEELRGQVVGADGKPVGGAHITVTSTLLDQVVRELQADDEGRFVVPALGPEEHTVEANAPSDVSGWAAADEAIATGVRAGGAEIEVRISHALTLYVSLVDDVDGSVVATAGLDIVLQEVGGEGRVGEAYSGGEMSALRVRAPHAGTYNLRIAADGFEPMVLERLLLHETGETRAEARLRRRNR